MNIDLSDKLCLVANELGVKFTFKGKQLSNEEVFSTNGLMPALAKRADRITLLCMGYSLGAIYEQNGSALLGTTVKFDDSTPTILRLVCILDQLKEIIKSSPSKDIVSLDELIYD